MTTGRINQIESARAVNFTHFILQFRGRGVPRHQRLPGCDLTLTFLLNSRTTLEIENRHKQEYLRTKRQRVMGTTKQQRKFLTQDLLNFC